MVSLSELKKISTPSIVFRKFNKYKGNDNATIGISSRPDKKYVVHVGNRSINFGSTMPDFTKHKNLQRRENYLKRANGIKGNWRNDKYSKNNLAIHLLW